MHLTDTAVITDTEVSVILNKPMLEQLRLANGIESNAALARTIGVDVVTLHRVTAGKTPPSNQFMARVLFAFPHTAMDKLFTLAVKRATAVA